jgi:adenine-specific DNA-methyltransferase
MAEQDFIKAGFTVVGTETNEKKLLSFLKENYPNVIRDTEINIEELKAVLGLPIDEKVNGYGLNFVGRYFARAKYAQKTEKELRLNSTLSKNIDTTENMVLKGDNIDSLKILKNYYSGKIKCIYIDPPYNTASDEFVYPDKFDKEEAEVLGLTNMSESDYARMDFSFRSKKSHNGWLAFMYPRLLLAKDLLSNDGAIFISIDDNEQANLKLLCDDVFGEDNFVGQFIINSSPSAIDYGHIGNTHEYALFYGKDLNYTETYHLEEENKIFKYTDAKGGFNIYPLYNGNVAFNPKTRPNLYYPFYLNPNKKIENDFYEIGLDKKTGWIEVYPVVSKKDGIQRVWRWGKVKSDLGLNDEIVGYKTEEGEYRIVQKTRLTGKIIRSLQIDTGVSSRKGTAELQELFTNKVFSFPKPVELIRRFIAVSTEKDSIVLDFFAGSGTTGHAVMQLNAEDGGNRKFILCQEDIEIEKDQPSYQFCFDNELPPLISSITIERLKRAGEKILKDIETESNKMGMFVEYKKQVPDIGFKVFDSVNAPKLKVDDKGQISITENRIDALSRVYNMIFTVGLDEPTQVPEEVVKDCIYKIGNHYYFTNSEKITSIDFSKAIKNGKVFIDGWTASLNGTLQNYKEDVKIVF